MRMRKKKWAEPYIEAHEELVIPDPSVYKGKWRELLNVSELHVEIGMGKGGYLNTMAAMYPKAGWVGIERDRSAAATAARKLIEDPVLTGENERMIAGNAEQLLEWFGPGEIDVIHLNFSDPWPKTYTHKRRLSSERFLAMYKVVLGTSGTIRMKTDNTGLFEDSVLYFLQNGFTFTEFSVDYRRTPHPEDAVTEYEQRFMDLGQPIYQLCAKQTENKTE
ncbi:MAG: tRNA (guanosine(46)-N7)-methyltransferase TrmB [Solobacterium sp.]|nr:tRNA (guanosine(46)-N7)-methyltransferase TrmB [Solobacterium sp.]